MKTFALSLILAIGVANMAMAENVVKPVDDPGLQKAIKVLESMCRNKGEAYKSTLPEKISERNHKDLDKVLILGGSDIFPM